MAVSPKIIKKCKCGNEFVTTQKRIDAGRGKFCSKACKLKYHQRHSGLKYIIKKENPTQFKKGVASWNKGHKQLLFHGKTYEGVHGWLSDCWANQKLVGIAATLKPQFITGRAEAINIKPICQIG